MWERAKTTIEFVSVERFLEQARTLLGETVEQTTIDEVQAIEREEAATRASAIISPTSGVFPNIDVAPNFVGTAEHSKAIAEQFSRLNDVWSKQIQYSSGGINPNISSAMDVINRFVATINENVRVSMGNQDWLRTLDNLRLRGIIPADASGSSTNESDLDEHDDE